MKFLPFTLLLALLVSSAVKAQETTEPAAPAVDAPATPAPTEPTAPVPTEPKAPSKEQNRAEKRKELEKQVSDKYGITEDKMAELEKSGLNLRPI